MSNRLTTWELKAVDNLPDLIGRMQQIVNLMQQQAALSATNSAAIQGQLSNLSTSYNNLQKQMQGVTTVQQQQVTATNQQAAATRQMQQQYEALRSTATSLTTIMAGVFSVAKTKEFLLDVIDANTRVNLFSKSLEAMLRNKTLADQVSAYALDMAQRSPLKVEQIMEVTQRLVAMGAEGSKITTYLEMLGEISSVVGTQKLPLIAKALLDVQNKQKLYAQEIRQFTDNGVPLYQLLADSMDLPIQKVKKLAEEHKITFKDVEKALLDATKQGGIYYGSMARNAEELGGKLSNLSDVVFLAKARFGEFIKEGLGNAITAVANFVKSITATDAAMERTINAVKAVTAAVVAYTLATKVGAAAVIAKELVMRAYTIAVGTSQMALQALTGAMGAHITINTAATVAARAFWATLAANPIGLVISLVGIATTAYYGWKATTSEMSRAQEELTERITKSTAPLELARIEFTKLGSTILSAKSSAEQKAAAFEKLQKLYPLQMAGITSLADAERKLSGLMKEVNNDFLIRIKLLENEVRTQVNNEAAVAAVREKIKLEGELATASTKRAEIYGTAGKMEVYSDAEVLKSRIAKLDKTIQESQKFNQNIASQSERLTTQINEDWTAKTAAGAAASADAFAKGENAKKAKAVLTAKEIAVALGEIQQVTLEDQIKLIEAQKKLDIERVNHTKLTKEQAVAAVKAIGEKAEADTLQLIYDNRIKIEAIEIQHQSKIVELSTETVKSKKKDEKELLEYIAKSKKEEQKLIEETSDIQKKSRSENLQLMLSYLGSLGGAFQDVARIGKKVIDDIDLIGGGALNLAKQQHESAKANAQAATAIFGEVSKQAADANLKVKETGKSVAEIEAAASQATLGIALMIFDTMKNVAVAINQSVIETNNAIIKSYETVKQSNADFYNAIIRNSEEAFQIEIENFRGNIQERNELIDAHYAKQKEYAEGRELINLEATRAQAILELDNQLKSNLWGNAAKDLANIEAAYYSAQAFEEQMRQEKFQREVDNARQIRDAKIDAIREEMDAYRAAKEEEIRLENEALDARMQKTEQFYSDKEMRLVNDDVYRQQLLDAGEAREIAALEAAKQREIDRATQAGATAEEIARIKEAFDKSIAEVHTKYQDVIMDKDEAVKLATVEAKAQETDEKNKLEAASAVTINGIKDQIAAKDAQTKLAMTYENERYRDFVLQANREMLESQKAMAIAQIKAEIAILKGKRNIFNSGRINAAIGDMENAIRELEGIGSGPVALGDTVADRIQQAFVSQNKANKTPFNADTMAAVTEAFNEEGTKIELTYTDEDRSFYAKDASGNTIKIRNAFGVARRTVTNPDGTTSEEVKNYFQGTPYIDGIGYPNGRDTVPAMVNKGERVMQTHLNELIGGARVSNEELAAKKLFADKVLGRVADIRGLMKRDTFLAPLPSYMMQGAGMSSDLDALANQIVAAINKPSVSINVSPRGLSVKERGQRDQNETYYNNTSYKRNW